jgi:hypothetical protein
MGEVWIGKHRTTGCVSAVKLLHGDAVRRERAQHFVARERRALSRLVHPHIVALHELGDGFIATAYVSGADLSRRMQTPIEPRVAIRFALQIASALAHSHARGVVHRDVKPSNILIDARGNAYLTDFGLAALVEDGGAQERAGTPAFMPPEQLRGEAGPAADQFALARTLAMMLAGVSVSGEGDPIALLPASLPASLVAALRRATSPEQGDRFPSIDAFATALGEVDLRDAEAPMRLAPEQRVRAPFAWARGARNRRAITHEIHCADYRLEDLVRAALLSDEEVAVFQQHTGIEELAWTAYVHEGRLGSVTSDAALARASDLVVILHGIFCSRRDWHDAAVAICRDNAQAVVLVPDLFGAGESRYAKERRKPEGGILGGTMDAVIRWLDLLNVRDLPTVLVGHSISGAALLAASDDQLGERVSRIAVTPGVATMLSPAARAFMRTVSGLASLGPLRAPIGRLMRRAPDFVKLDEEVCDRLYAELLRAPAWLMSEMTDEFLRSQPAPAESLRRCAVLVSEDDTVFPARLLEPHLVARGVPKEFIHWIVDCGHYPQLEKSSQPEKKARNVEQITRVVDSMLNASREGAPLTTMLASTVLGESTQGERSRARAV